MRRTAVAFTGCLLTSLVLGCSDPLTEASIPSLAKAPAALTVTGTDPGESSRDTTLVVQVLGTGFDDGSRADFLLSGVPDTNIVTNSTQFVSSTQLAANITVRKGAVVDYRDVAVTTHGGKKGIGTLVFQVVSYQTVPIAGASASSATGVNSAGLIVGSYTASSDPCIGSVPFAFSQAGGLTNLPMPAGYCSFWVKGVADDSVIAGYATPSAGGSRVVVRWHPTGSGSWNAEVLPLPSAGGSLQDMRGPNASGDVVAMWRVGTMTPWIWQDGTGWTRLSQPSGSCTNDPQGVSDADLIVGYCAGALFWASPSAAPVYLPTPANASYSDGFGLSSNGAYMVGVYEVTSHKLATDFVARWDANGPGGWILRDSQIQGRAESVNNDGVVAINGTPPMLWFAAGGTSNLFNPPKSSAAPVPVVRGLSNRGASGSLYVVGTIKSGNSSSAPDIAIYWQR